MCIRGRWGDLEGEGEGEVEGEAWRERGWGDIVCERKREGWIE